MLCFSKSLPSPDVSILGSSTSISQQSSKQVTIRMDLHIESNLSVCEEENETSVWSETMAVRSTIHIDINIKDL